MLCSDGGADLGVSFFFLTFAFLWNYLGSDGGADEGGAARTEARAETQ